MQYNERCGISQTCTNEEATLCFCAVSVLSTAYNFKTDLLVLMHLSGSIDCLYFVSRCVALSTLGSNLNRWNNNALKIRFLGLSISPYHARQKRCKWRNKMNQTLDQTEKRWGLASFAEKHTVDISIAGLVFTFILLSTFKRNQATGLLWGHELSQSRDPL